MSTRRFNAQSSPQQQSDVNEIDRTDYSLAAYDYALPPEYIAQNPVTPRDSSRLLVVDSGLEYASPSFSRSA